MLRGCEQDLYRGISLSGKENYFKMKKMKANCNWVITNIKDSNLNVTNHGNFTSYETDDVMVAVVNDSDYDKNSLKLSDSPTLKRKKTDICLTWDVDNAQEGNSKQNKAEMECKDDLNSSNSFLESCDSDGAEECSNKQVEKQTIKRTKLYEMEQDKYLLLLPIDERFTFQGKLQVTLVSGDVEIFGYRLNNCSLNKTLNLYSPRRNMQFCILSKQPYESLTLPELEAFLEDKLSKSDLQDLKKVFTIFDSLLIIEKLDSVYSPILKHYCDEADLFYDKEIMQEVSPIASNLDCLLDLSIANDRKLFTEGYKWKMIQPEKCTVICGGKGVGKSTLLKYLINTQLMRNQSVLCLDFDPGQSEFTAPGAVSAVLVKEPLFGPNFTHIIKPEK